MAITFRYRCLTCNTDLGDGGSTLLSHLASNPTHIVDYIVMDDSTTLAQKTGAIQIYNGEPYYYDSSRGMTLSIGKNNIFWGIPVNSQNLVYLRLAGSMTPVSANTGYVITQPSVITSISANNRTNNTTATYQIKVYGGSVLGSIVVPTGSYMAFNDNATIILPYPATISCYLSATGRTNYPQCSVEIRSYKP